MSNIHERRSAQNEIMRTLMNDSFRKILDSYLALRTISIEEWRWDNQFAEWMRENHPETQRKFGIGFCACDVIEEGRVDGEIQNYVAFVMERIQRNGENAAAA